MKVLDYLAREPVRLYLYSLASAVVVMLVALGILQNEMVLPIMGVVAAVVAIPGVESLRARVTPYQPEHSDTV